MKILLVLLVLSVSAFAQQHHLGNVSNVASVSCPSGFPSGADCSSATVSCPKVADIGVVWGITGTPRAGTIIYINGNGGTSVGGDEYAQTYTAAGFSLIQIIFDSDWEAPGGNLLNSACRPSTLVDYFHRQTTGAYCAQGDSAGSGAIGYGMAWYGLAPELNNVEFTVGPVFSDVATGCKVPHAPAVKVIPTDGVSFMDNPWYNLEWRSVSSWTNTACLPPNGSSPADLTKESAQSILQSGATLSYPNTSIAAWDCNNGLNPSAAQSYLFLQQVTTPWTLTALSGCTGAEGVYTGVTPQGVSATVATADHMIAHCVKK